MSFCIQADKLAAMDADVKLDTSKLITTVHCQLHLREINLMIVHPYYFLYFYVKGHTVNFVCENVT